MSVIKGRDSFGDYTTLLEWNTLPNTHTLLQNTIKSLDVMNFARFKLETDLSVSL